MTPSRRLIALIEGIDRRPSPKLIASRLRALGATTSRELAAARCDRAAKASWAIWDDPAADGPRISDLPEVQSIQADVDAAHQIEREEDGGFWICLGALAGMALIVGAGLYAMWREAIRRGAR